MSGYPQNPSGYGYGAPPPSQQYYSTPYGAPAAAAPPYGQPQQYPYGTPYQPSPSPYGNPFAALVPSTFPPGTDPNVIACFQVADVDGSGVIDDKELQRALSSYNQSFSIRTVRLLMYLFTNTNTRHIGPKEFTQVFYSLQSWRANFEKFDRDRSGQIDAWELRDALMSLGFVVSPVVLDLLASKFDKTGGNRKSIEYDNFIECCLIVKGLTEKFKERDTTYSGHATFTYEAFMLTVLPFLIV
ncbi:hypothetical protein L1987_29403 [Smallanthus sonchifolius]|uniref:Uncharacterized protein n=1 Tax=Smallanthus sonchifolius TaxID=185202 RepID=A0ACB9HZV8_9ASTR|nr:hypothetical protein L1987_29403 [Smallanthus sonchifolius]